MEKRKKDYKILKSKYPDKFGDYILWLHISSKYGDCWRGLHKGTKKDCIKKKMELLNE